MSALYAPISPPVALETATINTTKTADLSVYGAFDYTMGSATTLTFSNPTPSGTKVFFDLILRGAFTPTFPASVKWTVTGAPTYTTPAEYVFTTVDGGTTWLGAQSGRGFA